MSTMRHTDNTRLLRRHRVLVEDYVGAKPEPPTGHIQCGTCHTWKPYTEYSPSHVKANRGPCRGCAHAYWKGYRTARRERPDDLVAVIEDDDTVAFYRMEEDTPL